MSKKPRLLVTSPLLDDANSAWRVMGPLSKLKDKFDITTIAGGDLKWHHLLMTDIFWTSRPFMQQHVNMSMMAKNLGVPVISEIDDDLLHVPTDNPTYHNYAHPAHQQGVRQCHMLADLLFLSTNHLNKIYGPYAAKTVVVNNAYDDRLMKFRIKDKKTKTIVYRGSDSHVRDVLHFQKEILDVYAAKPDWKWDFLGFRPWFLADYMPKANFHGGWEFITYYQKMVEINPDIIIVPLHDNIFNHSKSNIAALEGAVMGAVALVPDWEEWKRIPGVVTYTDKEDFKKKLLMMMDMPEEELLKRREQIKNYFETECNLDKINAIREKAIMELYEEKCKKNNE